MYHPLLPPPNKRSSLLLWTCRRSVNGDARRMDGRYWYPRSTRNRIAMLFAYASLALMIIWNLFPYPAFYTGTVAVKPQATVVVFWPSAMREIIYFHRHLTVSYLSMLNLLFLINLFILPPIAILTPPLWKIFSSSRLMRVLSATVVLNGFAGIVFFYLFGMFSPYFLFHEFCIGINFLFSALALLLFKNENAPQPDHFVTSGKKIDLS
jgi:hypothetical protein